MIKHIKHQNVTTTPFRATKARELYNVLNPDGIILEEFSASVKIPDTALALDYVNYTAGDPHLNRDCNIALEQQTNDFAAVEEGIKGNLSKFNPDTSATNLNGSYKNLVYNQIKMTFYNDWNNPTRIFGMEHIDFPLSKTNRYLADSFRVFTVPRLIMGDRISPGSILLQDTSFDDNVTIRDDSNGNLVAGDSLFSKVQEVGSLGNEILQGTTDNECPALSG